MALLKNTVPKGMPQKEHTVTWVEHTYIPIAARRFVRSVVHLARRWVSVVTVKDVEGSPGPQGSLNEQERAPAWQARWEGGSWAGP